MEVIECNTEVAVETAKSKMAESRFASSDEIIVDQLKLNAKKQKHY